MFKKGIVGTLVEYKGISQSNLADLTGLSSAYINQLALGKRDIQVSRFIDWCALLECDPICILEKHLKKIK